MRQTHTRAILLVAALGHCALASSDVLAITDVTVIDTRTGARAPHQTVVINDGRIASVGTAAPPSDAHRISGSGRFLIPGLWDMVTHLSWTRSSALPLLAAKGITAVRDEGGDLAETAAWTAAVKAGTTTGPTIFQVGPMLNGKSFNRYQYALASPEAARDAVRLLKFEGVDGLELERRVPRDVYVALMAEAKASGVPVGGKVSIDITPSDASNAGQSTIDNLETLYDGQFHAAHSQDLDAGMDEFLAPGGAGDAVFATFRRNETAVTPCLSAVMGAMAYYEQGSVQDPTQLFVARSVRAPPPPLPPDVLAEFHDMVPRLLKTVSRLQAAGVVLLAGTDMAADRVPGFSLHEELDDLSTAGLSPLQVLQTATLNPAIVMKRTADYGRVEDGKIADLVLLDADPTLSVSALHQIDAIVLHGKLLRHNDIEALLRAAKAEASEN